MDRKENEATTSASDIGCRAKIEIVKLGPYFWSRTRNENCWKFQKEFREVQVDGHLVHAEYNHENIIHFSHPPHFDAEFCLTSSLRMDLGTCSHLLDTVYQEGFPQIALCSIAKAVLSALEYLHSNRIIHRAVRAGNILLDSSGQIRLDIAEHALHMGHSPRWIGVEDRVHDFSALDDVLAWIAPEVLRQDLNGYGLSSDIYSFGVCLCELGNGIPPFAEMEPLQILYEKLRGTTPFLLDSNTCEEKYFKRSPRLFSPTLHQMINECLNDDPQKRLSANQLLREYANDLFAIENEGSPELLTKALPLAKKMID